ncbi:hypothetical protein ECDEC8C_3355 [Escherichia coli DEC8C]|nr:hypothetical protein ECDEC8C_3355 [Escherichia coli DEC8C]
MTSKKTQLMTFDFLWYSVLFLYSEVLKVTETEFKILTR